MRAPWMSHRAVVLVVVMLFLTGCHSKSSGSHVPGTFRRDAGHRQGVQGPSKWQAHIQARYPVDDRFQRNDA